MNTILKEVDSIASILSSLSNSATFAMSRGGRELFHTNFLAHILDILDSNDDCANQSYEVAVKRNILSALFKDDSIKPRNVITFRERSNFDLIIIPALDELKEGSTIVVIEAKLKSTPTSEQLEKYNKKLQTGVKLELFDQIEYEATNRKKENRQYDISKIDFKLGQAQSNSKVEVKPIVISLNEASLRGNERPTPLNGLLKRFLLAPESVGNSVSGSWDLLGWESFLNNLTPKDIKPVGLLGLLIKDYIDSTSKILELVKHVEDKAESFTKNEYDFAEFENFSVNRHDFKNARLHDLVGKIAYSYLLEKLVIDIKKSLNETLEKPSKNPEFEFNSYTYYEHSQPALGVEFKLKFNNGDSNVSIGVQLQGNHYRHFIARHNCTADNYTFNYTLEACAESIRYWMTSASKNTSQGFNFFNKDKFVYQKSLIDPDLRYEGLKCQFIASINGAYQQIMTVEFKEKLAGLKV